MSNGKTVLCRADEDLVRAVTEKAKTEGKTVSDVLREALMSYAGITGADVLPGPRESVAIPNPKIVQSSADVPGAVKKFAPLIAHHPSCKCDSCRPAPPPSGRLGKKYART